MRLPTMDSSTEHEYVTLVSCDGFEFILPRSSACISGTIRRMLDPSSVSSHVHDAETPANLPLRYRQILRGYHRSLCT
jgi:hypothetical protein